MILTTSEEGLLVEAFTAGTLAGAGSFRCEGCGFKIALHELDEVPGCSQCGGRKFKRGSMFMGRSDLIDAVDGHPATRELEQLPDLEPEPEWVDEAREAL